MNTSLVDKIKNMLEFSKRNSKTMTGEPADDIIVHPGGGTTSVKEAAKYNIPNDRSDLVGDADVDIGLDKDLEKSDTKKQLKRRKAMKLIKAMEGVDDTSSDISSPTGGPPSPSVEAIPSTRIMKPKKSKPLTTEDSDPCWKDYKQVGMKKKNGKKVPNCVPEERSAHRIKYNDMTKQWHHSFNGGFTWKPVTAEQAKSVNGAKFADISARFKLDK
jgi:hypothetical protein